MNWTLQLPYRSRSDTLADVAEAARELPQGKSRDIARQVALGAARAQATAEFRRRVWEARDGERAAEAEAER